MSLPALVDVLWGDGGPARPNDQVAVLVSRLRRVLGSDRIVRSEAGFALVGAWLDLDELQALVAEAAAALEDGRVASARAAADAALSLVRGPVLPDDDGSWVEADRAKAGAVATRARGLAAAAALRAGDPVGAELAAEAVLADDPYDEDALRILMQAQVVAGRPASALASYARVRERLAEDLGASPSPATEELHAAVLGGAGGPPERPSSLDRLVGREPELVDPRRPPRAGARRSGAGRRRGRRGRDRQDAPGAALRRAGARRRPACRRGPGRRARPRPAAAADRRRARRGGERGRPARRGRLRRGDHRPGHGGWPAAAVLGRCWTRSPRPVPWCWCSTTCTAQTRRRWSGSPGSATATCRCSWSPRTPGRGGARRPRARARPALRRGDRRAGRRRRSGAAAIPARAQWGQPPVRARPGRRGRRRRAAGVGAGRRGQHLVAPRRAGGRGGPGGCRAGDGARRRPPRRCPAVAGHRGHRAARAGRGHRPARRRRRRLRVPPRPGAGGDRGRGGLGQIVVLAP